MTDNEIQQFRAELKALLTKYNATINFSVGSCSDTHGLYDEKIVISQFVRNLRKDVLEKAKVQLENTICQIEETIDEVSKLELFDVLKEEEQIG